MKKEAKGLFSRIPSQKLISKTFSSEALNHYDFHIMMFAFRVIILVFVSVRFLVYRPSTCKIESLFDQGCYYLGESLLVYTLLVVIGFLLLWKDPLLALNRGYIYAIALLETAVYLFWLVIALNIKTDFGFFFILPLILLVRTEREYRWIIGYATVFLILTPLIVYASKEWLNLPYPLDVNIDARAGYLKLLYLAFEWIPHQLFSWVVAFVMWRSRKRNRPAIIRQNCQLILDTICHKSNATFGYIRVVDKDHNYLVRIAHIGTEFQDDVFQREMLSLMDGSESMSVSAFRHNMPQIAQGRDNIKKKLRHADQFIENDIYYINANPIESDGDKVGTLSLMWTLESMPEWQRQQQENTTTTDRLYHYLKRERLAIDQWTEGVGNQHYLARKSEELNRNLTPILEITDFEKTSTLIIKAAKAIAEWDTAFILFYNDVTEQYSNRHSEQFGNVILAKDLVDSKKASFDAKAIWEQFPDIFGNQIPQTVAFPLIVGPPKKRKRIGVLFVVNTKTSSRMSLPLRVLLESLAKHGAIDLVNCINYTFSKQMRDFLQQTNRLQPKELVQTKGDSFGDFTRELVEVTQTILDSTSCSFISINHDSRNLEHWISTDKEFSMNKQEALGDLPSPISQLIDDPENIVAYDCTISPQSQTGYAQYHQINTTYSIRLDPLAIPQSDSTQAHILQGILFVNFTQDDRVHDRKFFTLLRDAINSRFANWAIYEEHRLEQQKRARSTWQFEIHDSLNELQFGVNLGIENLIGTLNNGFDSASASAMAQRTLTQSRSVAVTLKQIMEDMNDPIIVERGLAEALYALARKYNKDRVNNKGILKVKTTVRAELRPQIAVALHRIAREAIRNGFKHGGDKVNVILEIHPDVTRMTIRDNGEGFKKNVGGSGIELMKYQAALINARLQFETIDQSGKPSGARVICTWQNDTPIYPKN